MAKQRNNKIRSKSKQNKDKERSKIRTTNFIKKKIDIKQRKSLTREFYQSKCTGWQTSCSYLVFWLYGVAYLPSLFLSFLFFWLYGVAYLPSLFLSFQLYGA